MVTEAHAAAYGHCFDLLRERDHELWLTSLFWPATVRPHAHAILTFGDEIGRVREAVSEPMLGEIRLQWWREAIENEAPAGHPVAIALLDTIARFNLDGARFLALIEARAFDLYDDPMPSEAALEAYARDTWGVLLAAIARVLAPGLLPPPSVAPAALAFGSTRLLRELPYQVARGQLYLPLDLLDRLQVTPAHVMAHRPSPGIGLVLQTLRARVRSCLREMRETLPRAGPGGAACLPSALCEPALCRMERPGLDPFAAPIELAPWRQQWILWRAAKRL